MGKIKAWYRSIPLWLALFILVGITLIICSVLSSRITRTAMSETAHIGMKYFNYTYSPAPEFENSVTYYPLAGENGGVTGYNVIALDKMTPDDARAYGFFQFISQYAPAFIFSAGLLTAVLLFYFTKLKKPLALLLNASAKISKNEFDFSLEYFGHDEMARLCGAFEKMRASLDENTVRMRQMIAERKQLNDAYTHGLRTPVAILKGYADTLSEYLPAGLLSEEEVIETVHIMSAHVERLRQFVDSMNTAQSLTDLPIQREAIPTGDFVSGLRETAALLCEKQNLSCRTDANIEADTLNIDPSVVTQVFENMLGNALRFARTEIAVRLCSDGKTLNIRVADDGRGFSEKELVTAAKPYYSGSQGEKNYHFGLGLYICHTLCEKHGGSLKLENAENGGAVVTADFSI